MDDFKTIARNRDFTSWGHKRISDKKLIIPNYFYILGAQDLAPLK